MLEKFSLDSNCKFAIFAIQNVREDVPSGLTLRDGTIVLDKFPFALDNYWNGWLGTIQVAKLQACNLFLVRTVAEGWPEGHLSVFGGSIDAKLQSDLGGVFAMLRLMGTIEYENAFLLSGPTSKTTKQPVDNLITTETFKDFCGVPSLAKLEKKI